MKIKLTAAIIAAFVIIIGCAGGPKTSKADELDLAIRDASDYLNENIPQKSKIVILNVQSDSAALSDYIIDELIANAVNDKIFQVVDRQQLDLIRKEQNFQWSGEVDDKHALEIGKFFGAQTIVSGKVSQIAERYRFTIRALNVQTAQVQGQNNFNIAAGKTITALMNSKGGSSKSSTSGGSGTQTGTSAGTQTAQPAKPVQPATPARLKSGTYTFFPRLRPYQGASAHQDVYLWKIVVRGEFMSIYLTRSATGSANNEPNRDWFGGGHQESHYVLQDLNNPARSWNPSGGKISGYSWGDEGFWFNFKNVTATRFSFSDNYLKPPSIFDEIDLDKAQYEP
jgi:TolB-like protein